MLTLAVVELAFVFLVFLVSGYPYLRLLGLTHIGGAFLTIGEQAVLSFYLSGFVLYCIANTPIDIVSTIGLNAYLVSSVFLWGVIIFRDGGQLKVSIKLLLKRGKEATVLLTVGVVSMLSSIVMLLALDVNTSLILPDSYDGSMQALFVEVLLQHGFIQSTLAPFSQAGIAYPQGTSIFLAFSILMVRWPVTSAPLLVPPLFLGLAIIGSYCWGCRLIDGSVRRRAIGGMAFSILFALVGSWPRLLIVGWYDFVVSIPLLFVAFGLFETTVRSGIPSWRGVLSLGILGAILASISVPSVEGFVAFLLVRGVSGYVRTNELLLWLAKWTSVVAVSLMSLIRNLVEVVQWWKFPGHVLTQGGGPLSDSSLYPAPVLTLNKFVGWADPFLFRSQDVWLSPFPLLRLELAALLCGSLVISCIVFVGGYSSSKYWSSLRVSIEGILSGVLSQLLLLSLFVPIGSFTVLAQTAASFSSGPEISIILFTQYTALSALLIDWALFHLIHSIRSRSSRAVGKGRTVSTPNGHGFWSGFTVVTAAVLLSLTVVTGGAVSFLQEPQYLNSAADSTANVTTSDLSALNWAAIHLPPCSYVLVAPGSAAEYLPVYSSAHIVYQMQPPPKNSYYTQAIMALQAGTYNASVKGDLEHLQVTTVFVTGQSISLWLPLSPTPMEASLDFSLLFHSGDAYLFAFIPGTLRTGCNAS